MSKTEIIKTIAEQAKDNPSVVKGLFGKLIVEACQNELSKEFTIEDARKLNSVLSFNLMHIKTNQDLILRKERQLRKMEDVNLSGNELPYSDVQIVDCRNDIVDLNNQIESYMLNITNAIPLYLDKV